MLQAGALLQTTRHGFCFRSTLWGTNRVCHALPAAAIQHLFLFLTWAAILQHHFKPEGSGEPMFGLCSVGVCAPGKVQPAALLVCCRSACRRRLSICWLLISCPRAAGANLNTYSGVNCGFQTEAVHRCKCWDAQMVNGINYLLLLFTSLRLICWWQELPYIEYSVVIVVLETMKNKINIFGEDNNLCA